MPYYVWPKEIVRQVVLGLGLSVTIIFLWAVIDGYAILSSARNQVQDISSTASFILGHNRSLTDSADRAKSLQKLSDIEATAYSIDNRLGGAAALSVLSWVPFLGTQVDAVRQTASDFDNLCQQATNVAASVNQSANSTFGNHVSIPDLVNLGHQLAVSDANLASVHTSTAGLFGPVRSMRERFVTVESRIAGLIHNGHLAVNFAIDFFGGNGPRRYFLAGLNSAEMRDSGAVLSWSVFNTNAGNFQSSASQSVGALAIAHPAAALSPTTAAVFGPYEPTRVWQSVNAIGNFPTSAQWMSQMYYAARHERVNGVLALDTTALKSLLTVTGPVYVPEINTVVAASNVQPLLLHDLYVRFPAGADQQLRHADVSAVASAVVKRLSQGGYDPARLIYQLSAIIPGRHLMFWDSTPSLQAAIVHFGASGELGSDPTRTVHVSLQSGVAAKLDWFIRSSDHISIQISNDTAFITSTLQITNTAPANAQPSYALGPDHVSTFSPGQYVGRLYQWWPTSSQSPGAVPEEGLSLLQNIVRVGPQSQSLVVSQLVIPHIFAHGPFVLAFVPQGRVHPLQFTVDASGASGPSHVTWADTHPVTLTWTR